jgi:hypothetical protein
MQLSCSVSSGVWTALVTTSLTRCTRKPTVSRGTDVGIRHTVYIERSHGPSTDYYGYPTLQDLGGLPALVGLK